MQLKSITATAVLLLVVASLSVAGCSNPPTQSTPSPVPSKALEGEVKNQTIGLIQNGTFPPLTNESFHGNTLTFFKSWNWSDYSGGGSYSPYNESNNSFTIFFAKETKLNKTGFYSSGGGDAYNAQYDIYVIKYPEKIPIGKYTFISTPPDESHSYGDEVGDYFKYELWIRMHID